ncbi:uncharacterized protein N0V89_006478 [Didymosphaeria variabile]|uniref:F-box domain-containing protein n=1 Tax=Didymosphaeria variabile TaxID=1932322 RepID=A0A9W8XHC8_9PLEO|nr:uncharacterized protein N0V89_006478 [Didymosphaeria variabile]KAJ4351139.1 hypothetical protein N0V89_006478 [Didymosphaeria variabile]
MGKRDRDKLADIDSRDGPPPAATKRKRTDESKVELAAGETHHAGIVDFETLPEELCRQIMLACDWKTLIGGLSLASRKWNRIASERTFQSLSIRFSEEGTIAHKRSVVATLNKFQLRNIQDYTRRLHVKCGKSRESQDKALELARCVNPKRCTSLNVIPHDAFHEEVYAEAVRIATTMPKLMRMTIPAVSSVTEAQGSVQPERLHLKAALTFKVGHKQPRELVCDINVNDQLGLGTPKAGVFGLVSTGSHKESNLPPTKTNLIALQLKSNGTVRSDVFRSFMDDLGFREHRTEQLTKLDFFRTSIVGEISTIRTNLRCLGLRNLKILRVRECRDPICLLFYVLGEALQLRPLNLTTIDISGRWDSDTFEDVENWLLLIWADCPYMSDLTFESDRPFTLIPLLRVLRARGHALRRLKYRVGNDLPLEHYYWIFYHCRSLEELELDMPELRSDTGRDIFMPYLNGQHSQFTQTVALHGTTALHTLHLHLPQASFRRMASDRNQTTDLKVCLTEITNFNAKSLAQSKAEINLRIWAWTIHTAKGSSTKRFGKVLKKVDGSDSQEECWEDVGL